MNRLDKIKLLGTRATIRKNIEGAELVEIIKGIDGKDGRTGDKGLIGEKGERGYPGTPGLKGEKGSPGNPGKDGERGFPGKDGIDGQGITWQDQWQPLLSYSVNDAVFNYGSAYICTQAHISSRLTEPGVGQQGKQYWAVLAERGETGPGGANGTIGHDGAAGVGVATGGTSGQVLAKNSNTNYDTHWIDVAGTGTVTNVSSADANATVANPTTTPVITIVSAPKLATARNIDGQAFDGTGNVTVIAPGTHAATSKATPVDADELPLVDSAASNVLKKLTWANLKATLKTYFDGIYQAALGFTAENIANKSTDGTFGSNSDTLYPSQKAAKTYADTKLGATASAGGDLTGNYPNPTVISNVGLSGNPTATTQAPADNSTKIATTGYVDNAVLGQRTKEAAKYATTGALPTVVYANGSSGVGATLTGAAVGALSLDSQTPSVGNRVLVKDQVSTFQNGLYTVTAVGSGIAVFVMTRASDFDQATDIQTGDSVFVTNGTLLANTTWAYNGIDNPVMGTDAITFAQAAGPGSYTAGNGISITGVSIAINTSVTVDKTTAQTLTNKTLTSPVVNTPTGIVKGDVGLGSVTNDAQIKSSDFPSSSVDSEVALFSSTTGKVIKRASATGIASLASGVLSAVTAPSGAIVGDTDTQTLTNKRITKRVLSLSAGSATPAINTDSYDVVRITAQNAAITSFTTNLTGTPVTGDTLRISITDDGTGRALTWGTSFEASTVALPTTTVASARLDVGFFWNVATSKWRCVAVA